LPYLIVINDACTTRKQPHAKYSRRLAQSSSTAWLNHARNHETSNAMATSHHAYSACAKNNLMLTADNVPTKNHAICRCKACCLRRRKSKSLTF